MQENYGITYEAPSWSEKFQVKKKRKEKLYNLLKLIFMVRREQEVDHIVRW